MRKRFIAENETFLYLLVFSERLEALLNNTGPCGSGSRGWLLWIPLLWLPLIRLCWPSPAAGAVWSDLCQERPTCPCPGPGPCPCHCPCPDSRPLLRSRPCPSSAPCPAPPIDPGWQVCHRRGHTTWPSTGRHRDATVTSSGQTALTSQRQTAANGILRRWWRCCRLGEVSTVTLHVGMCGCN